MNQYLRKWHPVKSSPKQKHDWLKSHPELLTMNEVDLAIKMQEAGLYSKSTNIIDIRFSVLKLKKAILDENSNTNQKT